MSAMKTCFQIAECSLSSAKIEKKTIRARLLFLKKQNSPNMQDDRSKNRGKQFSWVLSPALKRMWSLQNITNLLQILTVMSVKASYHNYSWFAWHWNILQKSGIFSQNRSIRPWKNSCKLREIWIKRKPTVNNVKYFLGVVWVTKVTQDTLTSKWLIGDP